MVSFSWVGLGTQMCRPGPFPSLLPELPSSLLCSGIRRQSRPLRPPRARQAASQRRRAPAPLLPIPAARPLLPSLPAARPLLFPHRRPLARPLPLLDQWKPTRTNRTPISCWVLGYGTLQPYLVKYQEECDGSSTWPHHFRSLCHIRLGDRVLEPGDFVLAERRCLERYEFSRGDVVLFKCPSNHKELFVKRLIALPGELIQLPGSHEVTKIPEGHCWVEGGNAARSWDSRAFGPVPLGLVQGRVTHIIWQPSKIGQVERKMPEGRISPV